MPVLARGGWAGRDTLDWGILTGVHASGLPAGHCWSGGTNSIEGLATAPTQLIFFGREMARPSAQELTVEILHNAARALRGELSGHVTLGQAWLSGPAGMNRWAERLESGERYCTICADDRRCLQRVTEFYRASRRWAGRFLSETAALRLNSVRPARELGRQMQALADGLGTDPGTIRAAGQAELELAGRISELLGE